MDGIMLIVILSGLIMGYLTKLLTKLLIHKRETCTLSKSYTLLFENKFSDIFWCLFSMIGYITIYLFTNKNLLVTTELLIVFTICLSMSITDLIIRKIPNDLLIVLIAIRIIMMVVLKENPTSYILGMLFAGMILMLPAKFGKFIGMGDIKLSMIIGLYLGIYGFISTIAIMGLGLLGYLAYLLATKKGDLKTPAALGPYLSVGFLVTQVLFTLN